jgi:hypothetical protein
VREKDNWTLLSFLSSIYLTLNNMNNPLLFSHLSISSFLHISFFYISLINQTEHKQPVIHIICWINVGFECCLSHTNYCNFACIINRDDSAIQYHSAFFFSCPVFIWRRNVACFFTWADQVVVYLCLNLLVLGTICVLIECSIHNSQMVYQCWD